MRRILTAATLAAAVAMTTGCATAPPPVSQKVQDYYDKSLVNASPSPTATPKASGPVATFLGDSYTQGEGATAGQNWVSLVAAAEGWSADNLGRGGTGYVTTSDVNGCGLDVCPNYQQMAYLAIAKRPAVVVVAGGQNDFDDYASDPDEVAAAIKATFTKLRVKLPKAKIVAVGPSTPWTVDENVLGLDTAVQDAAAAVKATYVSLLDPNVVSPDMTLADKAHVNDSGHKAIAERVISTLR